VRTFSAYVEWDPETKLYVGIVPGIPGAHTQGATLDELQNNLKEVLELCLQEYQGSLEDLPRFVGLQQVEVAVWLACQWWASGRWRRFFFAWGLYLFARKAVTFFSAIPTAERQLFPTIREGTLLAPWYGRSYAR
jgi:predicted RNase H-like HicB family nuclease